MYVLFFLQFLYDIAMVTGTAVE